MKLRQLILSLFLLLSGFIWSQDPIFFASASQTQVAVGERFKVSFELENGDGKISPPPMGMFDVLQGPSTSQSYSYVNGKSSKKLSVSYILRANQIGDFKIGKASTKHNGKTLYTKEISIKVVKGSGNNTSTNQPQSNVVNTKARGRVILEVQANKKTAYVNEPVTLTYKLYSQYSNLQLGEINLPSPNGFWVEDIELENRSWERQLATIGNARYRQVVLAKRVVYPQKSGELSTGISEIEVFVNRSFFDPGQKIEVKSNDLKIKAKALPSNAPMSFKGIVGDLKASTSLSSDSCAVDDAITFKLKISGTGNLRLLDIPNINFPQDFEVYEPKVRNNLKVNNNGIYGSKTFEWTLIPRYPGDYEIPAYEVAYFDANKRQFKSNSSESNRLKVTGSSQSFDASGGNRNAGSRVRNINEDIRYIHTGTPRETDQSGFSEKTWMIWFIRIAILILGVVAWFIIGKNEELKQDQVAFKASKAAKKALKKLATVEKDSSAKAADVYNTLVAFICERLRIEFAEFKRAELEQQLSARNIKNEHILETNQFLEKCEMAGYAVGTDDPKLLAQEAKEIVKKLNRL